MTFGNVNYEDKDFAFVSELKYNNAVFSAFKTHRQQNELHSLMWDDKGKPRSFAEFKKASSEVIGRYNTNWLETEYSTAMVRANFAAQWRKMGEELEDFPNVKWLPSTAVNPREQHKDLYNRVFAYDDPFLQSNYPGSLWGCLCSVTSTNEPITNNARVKAAAPKPTKGLDKNPASSGMLFTASHPYFVFANIAYKKLKPVVEKWIKSYNAKKLPKRNTYQKVAPGVYVNSLHSDHETEKNVAVAKRLYSYKKKNVFLLPNLDPSNASQAALRASLLPKSVKENKNPDAYINGEIWEFKTLENNVTKNSLQRNVKEAKGQANNIALLCKGELANDEVARIITGQALNHDNIYKVIVLYNDNVIKFIRDK